jgi:selenocysteine-specific elongation factor
LEQYHELNPLQAGMRKDELKGRLLPEADAAAADGILDIFAERGIIHIEGQRAALGAFQIIYSDAQKKIAQEVSGIYAQGGYSVPNLDDVQQGFSSASDREIFKQVLQSMLDSHTLVCISPQIFLHKDHFLNALKVMREIQAADGEISLGALRDRLSTSRKYAYAFLEYCDRNKITKRTGDLRRLTGREDFFIE